MAPPEVPEWTKRRLGCVDDGTDANHRSHTANCATSSRYTATLSGANPFITASVMLPPPMDRACCTNPFIRGGPVASSEPKICCRISWYECPGSGSTNCAPSPK